ncbi:hypothetical protein [Microbacterium sp.]|uniref:hypothetical protein n=1 Tax=Microbacterium sp. TaxID=51671 RepID=UPI00273695DD|nr:hypothetical protein [Microbacterium sp.]MDP3949355.1 hypothetical protein [Microbacterium sp.]
MKVPTVSDATTSLAEAERLATRVRSTSSPGFAAWLGGVAVASIFYLTGLGVAGDDELGIVVLSCVLGASLLALSVGFLPGARIATRGFGLRWGLTLGTWGLVFGAVLGFGIPFFSGELWFWIPGAIASAAPLAIGAVWEARA